MTADDYINTLNMFVQRIQNNNESAEFVFIAPWMSLDNDSVSILDTSDRDEMIAEYTERLSDWCYAEGYIFSDPNVTLREAMTRDIQAEYLVDYIHPNRNQGIELYSHAVLMGSW